MSPFKKSSGFRPKNSGFRSGGSQPYQRNRSAGYRDSHFSPRSGAPITMHKATCAECGKATEVPFRPSGDRPVYCKECFDSTRDHKRIDPRNDFEDRRTAKRHSTQTSAALPSAPAKNDQRIDAVLVQLDAMQKQIDLILQYVKPAPTLSTVVARAAAKKVIKKSPAKKKASKK